MITLLTWSSLALAGAAAVAVCVLAVRRMLLVRRERLRHQTEIRLRPVALTLLEGDTTDARGLSEQDVLVLADLLGRFGRLVKGVESEQIASFFEQHGWLDRELRAARSRRAWRRATAAFALGDIGSRRAIPALLSLLGDHDREVRAAAARSLGRLAASEAVEPIVYALAEARLPRSVAGEALLAIGPEALERLRALVATPEADARAFAVELLGILGDASDDAAVVERLRDTSAEVRARAARALGRLGAEEATAELARALDDRIFFVRVAAANALASVGDRDVVPRLLAAAGEEEFETAHAAAQAVACLDPAALHRAAAEPDAATHILEAADVLAVRS